MNRLYIYLWVLVLVVLIQACGGKDDQLDPIPGSGKQLLLVQNGTAWKVSRVLSATNINVTAEYTAYRITFEDTDGTKRFTLVNRQGVTQPGTWSISGDETTITLNFADGNTQTLSSVTVGAGDLQYTTEEQSKTGALKLFFKLIPG